MQDLKIYHVVARAVRNNLLFEKPEDFERFKHYLGRFALEMGVSVLDFCFMNNHLHMLLECSSGVLPLFLQRLHAAYAQALNLDHDRFGKLFDSCTRAYPKWGGLILHSSAYSALNPVVARMVSRPEDYPHSSYGIRIGLRPKPSWMNLERISTLLSPDPLEAREKYRAYVEGIQKELPGTRVELDHWISRNADPEYARQTLPDMQYVSMLCAAISRCQWGSDLSEARLDRIDIKLWAISKLSRITLRMTAEFVKLSRQAIHYRLRRLWKILGRIPGLEKTLEETLNACLLRTPAI